MGAKLNWISSPSNLIDRHNKTPPCLPPHLSVQATPQSLFVDTFVRGPRVHLIVFQEEFFLQFWEQILAREDDLRSGGLSNLKVSGNLEVPGGCDTRPLTVVSQPECDLTSPSPSALTPHTAPPYSLGLSPDLTRTWPAGDWRVARPRPRPRPAGSRVLTDSYRRGVPLVPLQVSVRVHSPSGYSRPAPGPETALSHRRRLRHSSAPHWLGPPPRHSGSGGGLRPAGAGAVLAGCDVHICN